jgi:hypothetical protein
MTNNSITLEDVENLIEALADSVKGYVDRGFETTTERLEALEARPTMKYRGTYAADTDYEPGDVVTDAGSAWHCNKATRSRPSENSADFCWQLAVKRGRDGK